MAVMALGDGIDVLDTRSKLLRVLLFAGLALVVAVLVGEIAEYSSEVPLDPSNPSLLASFYIFASLGSFAITLLTIVIFCMWIYRAAANVVAAEVPGFDYTPGWAVGWFFIPFANLVKPFQAIRQIWNASHGSAGDALDEGHPLLTVWWATWLVTNIANNISARLGMRAETLDDTRTSLIFGMAGSLVSLILYPAALILVSRIAAAQRERLTASHIFT